MQISCRNYIAYITISVLKQKKIGSKSYVSKLVTVKKNKKTNKSSEHMIWIKINYKVRTP